jgi:predicted nuclease of restriction endonuclease-like (RecB) superfamily
MSANLPTEYSNILLQIKQRVNQARFQSLRAVNKELTSLYWDIGKTVSEKTNEGWGTGVVGQLSKDLQIEYPGVKGFSISNIWYMRTFYDSYKDQKKLQRVVGELPWGQNIEIFTKVKSLEERIFYAEICYNKGWSRPTLVKNIKADTYNLYKEGQNNFALTIDKNRLAELGWQFKDEYNLDFLELTEEHKERELEDGIVNNIIKFMGELGGQFSFVGRQFRLENPNGKEYFVDLLFYHRKLKSLIAVELKATEFKVEYGSKMSLYLNILDDTVKEEWENQSIGIIICQSKDRFDVEYTLNDLKKPIGVATYGYEELPKTLAKYLPSSEELEDALSKDK